jgi:hypothetical protein
MIAALLGAVLMLVALVDSFEAVVLPRRIARRWRLARMYYLSSWRLWRTLCRQIPAGRYRENVLSVFGPLSMLGLFAFWASLLIVGFALVHWGTGTLGPSESYDFWQCLYFSGETFFTLGYGDVTAATYGGKLFAVAEAGCGFGFMAIVIGYLPVLYQAFSHRERNIALLDARAGSPPTASELLRRASRPSDCPEIERFLAEWELWSAELLESHLSFPVLSYYRSQHDNQSWLAALAVVLDASATLLVAGDDAVRRRAELTFAMARHACVDLCLVYWRPPRDPPRERLTSDEAVTLFGMFAISTPTESDQAARLGELRQLYEPFLAALSRYFWISLPRFFPDRSAPDNWQTTPWTTRAPGITDLQSGRVDEHFG